MARKCRGSTEQFHSFVLEGHGLKSLTGQNQGFLGADACACRGIHTVRPLLGFWE